MDLWVLGIALFLCVCCTILYAVSIFRSPRTSRPPLKPNPPAPADVKQKTDVMARVDGMNRQDFERFCAELLEHSGYQQVHVTQGTGGQGVDIVAVKRGLRYAFQCRRNSSKIENTAVQQVHTGQMLYSCSVGVVITNNYFTTGAKQTARAVGVELWDRDVLSDKIARLCG